MTWNNLGGLYAQDRQHAKAEAPFQQSLALNKAIFDAHPKVVAFRLELAGSYVSMATHIRRTGSAEESLEWTAQAIGIVEPVLKQDPRNVHARLTLFNMLMGRGYAFVRLDRREEAAKDWRRMIEISEGQADIRMRLYRPFALVFLGEHAQATAEIETLVAEGQAQGRRPLPVRHGAFDLFRRGRQRRPAAAGRAGEAGRQVRRPGGRAAAQGPGRGLFPRPGSAGRTEREQGPQTVRSRPDFQKLLVELEKEAKPKP